jgi:hypothetical protein
MKRGILSQEVGEELLEEIDSAIIELEEKEE